MVHNLPAQSLTAPSGNFTLKGAARHRGLVKHTRRGTTQTPPTFTTFVFTTRKSFVGLLGIRHHLPANVGQNIFFETST